MSCVTVLYSRNRSTSGSISASALACFRYSAGSLCTSAEPSSCISSSYCCSCGQLVEHKSRARSAVRRAVRLVYARRTAGSNVDRAAIPPTPAAGTRPRRRRASADPCARSRRSPRSRSSARSAPAPETRARAAARRRRSSRPARTSRASSAAPAMSRSRANSRTVTRMRPAPPPRAPARRPDRPSRPRSRRRRPRRTRASRSARSA